MKKERLFWFLFVFAFTLTFTLTFSLNNPDSTKSLLAQTKKIDKILIVTEEYPPYEYLDNNKIKGQDAEILEEAGKVGGFKIEIQFVPWKRAISMVQEGSADAIISLLKTSEREAFLYFPDIPLSYEKNIIFVNKSFKGEISKISDLKGLEIGTMADYSYGKEFDSYKDATKVPEATQDTLLNKLVHDRYKVIINNEMVTNFLIKKMGLKKEDIRPMKYVANNDSMYIGFSKKSPNGKAAFEAVSSALKKMKDSGSLDKIRKGYSN